MTPEAMMRRHHALQRRRSLPSTALHNARRAMFAGNWALDAKERDVVAEWQRHETDAYVLLALAGLEAVTSPMAAMSYAVEALDAMRSAWRAQRTLDLLDDAAALRQSEREAEQEQIRREFLESWGWDDDSDD